MPGSVRTDPYSLLKNETKTKMKLQRLTARKNFLKHLHRLGIGTDEIEVIAKKVTNNNKSRALHIKNIRNILNIRIKNISSMIAKLSNKLIRLRKKRLLLFSHPLLRDLSISYTTLLQDQIFIDWKRQSQLLNNKLAKFRNKYLNTDNMKEVPDGVKYKDVDLQEYAKQIDFQKKPNFVTYGDLNLDHEEIEYLNIPVKDRAIEKVNMRDIRLELDRVAAKLRYGLMTLNDHDTDQEPDTEPSINIPYQSDTKTINMSGIPVTSFQYNTRVMPPKLGSGNQELAIQMMKSEVLKASTVFCNQKCDKSGKLSNMTLSKTEVNGRSKLLNRVKNGEIVISSTDKSGKIAVWRRELYIEAAEEHTIKDKKVTQELVNKFENQANGLATATCSAFKLGEQRNQEARVSKAMKVLDVPPPNVFILAKDHKEVSVERRFPKTRVVCGAKSGPISRLQNFYSLALGFVGDSIRAPSECFSTEVMQRGIDDTNLTIRNNPSNELKTIILSLDVCALYPSITADIASKSIFKMVMKSKVNFSGINYNEVGKILRVLSNDKELRDNNIITVVPARALDIVGKTMKVQTTYLESDLHDNKWIWRQNSNPNDNQKRTMMALLLARVTRWLIEHHVYSFNDEMFHQTDGAPIGLQIAVNISRLVMIDWDQQMMVLMINNNLKVELMMRYVDDVNIILRIQHHHKENNILVKEVAAKITEIADSVFPGVLVF